VAAVGVEPDISVENDQPTDSEKTAIAENATISKSAVQSLYKDRMEFPKLQLSDLSLQMRSARSFLAAFHALVGASRV
jgi:hypothetical protein